MATDWEPNASIAVLQQRAGIIQNIRQFFIDHNVLEVETPALAACTVTDPYIQSFKVNTDASHFYLQTSPEYHMKRLLAAGSGSIFQICKAFRVDEVGKMHNPEFSMLEWYRLGYDHHQLMDEVEALLQQVLSIDSYERFTYQEVFKYYLDINPHAVSAGRLQDLATHMNLPIAVGMDVHDADSWLQQLMSHLIEPKLRNSFIYDFPATQAALAKIRNESTHQVASRFEVYVEGIELANGFHELTDANQQRRRMQADCSKRKAESDEPIIIDERFISALTHGLPECAGVALGLDRLLMLALKQKHIADVVAFSFERA